MLEEGQTTRLIYPSDTAKTMHLQSYSDICVGCLVCGEAVPLSDFEYAYLHTTHGSVVKVCDKCKAAILHVRKQLEEE